MINKYMAYGPDGDFEFFNTMQEAKEWIEDVIIDDDEYHPDTGQCAIYEIKERIKVEMVDTRENHPEGEWYSPHDEIWKHSFVKPE